MAGKGYGKDVRQQMNTYNTANPNATADQKMGQRKSALTAAQTAMSQPGAAPSTRITNRLNRVNKRMPASPSPSPAPAPTSGKPVTTNPMPSTKPPVSGNILPGEENAGKLGGALPPTGVGGGTSLKKKKQPVPSPAPALTKPSLT